MRKINRRSKVVMMVVMVTMFLTLMSNVALALDPQPEPPSKLRFIGSNILTNPLIIGPNFNSTPGLIIH